MLSTRDPNLPLNRSLRQEKGSFGGESLYWYQPDLGGQQPPGYAERRISVVKLDKGRYAQISLYPDSAHALRQLLQRAQFLRAVPIQRNLRVTSFVPARPGRPAAARLCRAPHQRGQARQRTLRADFAVSGQRAGTGLAAAAGAGHEPDPVGRGCRELTMAGMTAWQHP